jgi:hypothetical protein
VEILELLQRRRQIRTLPYRNTLQTVRRISRETLRSDDSRRWANMASEKSMFQTQWSKSHAQVNTERRIIPVSPSKSTYPSPGSQQYLIVYFKLRLSLSRFLLAVYNRLVLGNNYRLLPKKDTKGKSFVCFRILQNSANISSHGILIFMSRNEAVLTVDCITTREIFIYERIQNSR